MADTPDPVADAMAVLLSGRAAAVIEPAVSGHTRVAELVARQVLFRPRRRVTVSYDAVLEWPDGVRRGQRIVALADTRRPLPDVPTVTAGELDVAVWRAPEDPYLPGLRVALDPVAAEGLLREAGVAAVGATAVLRGYRPGRRAVVEVRPKQLERPRLVISAASLQVRRAPAAATQGVFLKVLRPPRAAAVADIHERLGRVVTVPPCTLAGGPGILRLGAMAGATLGSSIRNGRPPSPPPEALPALLDRVAGLDVGGEPGIGSDERLRDHVELLRALLPEEAARLERLEAAFSGAAAQEQITIHGDFHEGNLLVDAGGIAGLLDVDDVGPGERVDDLGLLVGRVWSLGERAGERAHLYTRAMLRCFDELVDPAELRRRAGAALVGRATGPFRNQADGWREISRRRLQLAERWAGSGDR